MSKVAFCLHGKIGSIKGKHSNNLASSEDVLRKAHSHNESNIFNVNDDVDVFIHNWDISLQEEIIELYSPTSYLIEEQIMFRQPPWIRSSKERAFAHLSRWYSYQKVCELVRAYEIKHNFKYDYVIVQRFDMLWNIPVVFNQLNPDKFYVGNCSLNPAKEWSDVWFIGNSDDMYSFSKLYDKLEDYMTGEFPSSKQYAGISSHFLSRFHAKKLGLSEEFKFHYGYFGTKPNDFNIVRVQYYG